jgi:uncharacterized protein YbjT (DUF2867 family)
LILVFGANGNVGRELVRVLAAAGEPVRAVVRDTSRASAVTPSGVEIVDADLTDVATLRRTLADITSIFLLSGYAGVDQLATELPAHGVERVVLLSSSAAPTGRISNAVARFHILSERAVLAAGLPWTFLRPNSFMTNTYQWLPQIRSGDVVRAPFADVAVSLIDPADIAAVAAVGLSSSSLEGRALRLSGPQALRPADRVRILGDALDRRLRFEPIPDYAARQEFLDSGVPAQYADAFLEFFAEGIIDETTVLPTVGEVLGREPNSFSQWLDAHTERFR